MSKQWITGAILVVILAGLGVLASRSPQQSGSKSTDTAQIAGSYGPLVAEPTNYYYYTDSGFKRAQEEGKATALFFHAVWCDVCHAQNEVYEKILPEFKGKEFALFRADFDSEVDLKQSYGVRFQSTTIFFGRDGSIVHQETNLIEPDRAKDFIKQALAKG